MLIFLETSLRSYQISNQLLLKKSYRKNYAMNEYIAHTLAYDNSFDNFTNIIYEL